MITSEVIDKNLDELIESSKKLGRFEIKFSDDRNHSEYKKLMDKINAMKNKIKNEILNESFDTF